MSDPQNDPSAGHAEPQRSRLHTQAVPRRGRWPGLIWAIPLAALIVTAFLGLQAIANRGVRIVVTFKTSGGAQAGVTPVIYKGVTVGRVVKIRIAENSRDVDMTLRMEPRAKTHLRQGAKFWLIGAEPSLTDLSSSLKAVVAGVAIGVSPGTGEPQTHFIGLDQPPAITSDTPGTLYVLDGGDIGSTTVGSGVFYHGLFVGRVTRVEVADARNLRIAIFVNAPYDHLVHSSTLFFIASAANVSLSAGELNASLGPGTSVLTGGIEFDTPAAAADQPQSPANTKFSFYATEARAKNQPEGPEVRYSAIFRGASHLPQADAPIFLSGKRIGRVVAAEVTLPRNAVATVTSLDLELEPKKLALPTEGDVRSSTNEAISRLIRGGYRLTMGQYPPLVGTPTLIFQRTPGAPKAALVLAGAPQIPTSTSTGVDDVTTTANQILEKVNQVPIAEIGQNLRQITGRFRTLVSSPEVDDSLHKLDSTLTSVDQIAREAKPQVGPLIVKLNKVADEVSATASAARGMLNGDGADQDSSLPDALRQLTEAARSIRSLADYLGRHPEAVLKGKAKDAQ